LVSKFVSRVNGTTEDEGVQKTGLMRRKENEAGNIAQ
jgi:hypothetical protein